MNLWLPGGKTGGEEQTGNLGLTAIFKIDNQGFPGGAVVKNPPANGGAWVQALVQEDPTCRGAT